MDDTRQHPAAHLVAANSAVGRANRQRIALWMSARPGSKIGECAYALGLSRYTVAKHVDALRETWRARDRQDHPR